MPCPHRIKRGRRVYGSGHSVQAGSILLPEIRDPPFPDWKFADFVYLDGDNGLHLIHIEGATSTAYNRHVSASAYEVVAAQASKTSASSSQATYWSVNT